jgi:hypothetical protein
VALAATATAPRARTKRGHHGPRASRRNLMLLTMMGVVGAAPRDGYSAQVSTPASRPRRTSQSPPWMLLLEGRPDDDLPALRVVQCACPA